MHGHCASLQQQRYSTYVKKLFDRMSRDDSEMTKVFQKKSEVICIYIIIYNIYIIICYLLKLSRDDTSVTY